MLYISCNKYNNYRLVYHLWNKSYKLEYRNQAKTREVKIDHLGTLKIVIENDEIMIVSAQNPCGTEIPKDKIEIKRLLK